MPSDLIVPITEIKKIRPHPNADRLEIAEILGWQVVVGKGLYTEGQRLVYIPPDSVLLKWKLCWENKRGNLLIKNAFVIMVEQGVYP